MLQNFPYNIWIKLLKFSSRQH